MSDETFDLEVARGNPFAIGEAITTTAVTSIESSRAVAEVQARLMMADARPRNQVTAYNRIMQACGRLGLAEKAMYQYPRGGQTVRGPSIRLAEELARSWGNMDCGIAELSRSNGVSEVEAFAWDLETNTRFSKRFTVRHLRDKKGGAQVLTDERDIYELVANMGARRMRACILAAIPSDVLEDAVAACAATVAKGTSTETIQERARKLVATFAGWQISADLLEEHLGKSLDKIIPEDIVELRGILTSVRDGQSKLSDWFGKAEKPELTAKDRLEALAKGGNGE